MIIMDSLFGPRVITLLTNVPIFSDGVPISPHIIKRTCGTYSLSDAESLFKDCKFKIALVNQLCGIGSDNIHCITIVDFMMSDNLTAIDTTFIIHSDKNEIKNTISKLISEDNITISKNHILSSYLLTEDDYYTELSFLMHIIFGPPEWIYNINYNYWTHQHWANCCKSSTFKYHKVELPECFVKYLNSNTFYVPDNLACGKYIVKSDSESELYYSDNELSPNDSVDSVISLSDPELNHPIIAISGVLRKHAGCMVKYRNIFVLDGCWIINNSYTVTNERDVILLLKSSCKWRDCSYQEGELYLVERRKIDPSNEFRLYYIDNSLVAISQLHSHIKLPYLQNPNNRIEVVTNIIQLNNEIQNIIRELRLQYCAVDVALGSDEFIIDILPWGWNGPLAHEPLLDWRDLRLLYIANYKFELRQLFRCGVEAIKNVYFLYIESDNQVRNGPFGNSVHPDDICELEYQFS